MWSAIANGLRIRERSVLLAPRATGQSIALLIAFSMTLSAPQILGSPSAIAGKSFVTFAMLGPSLPLPIQKLNYAGCIRRCWPEHWLGRYGVYDIAQNTGWVNVGIDADTAQFAVESIRQWWKRMGRTRYPRAQALLICADSGGSNSYRSQLWKRELQKLCNQQAFAITVCHFPPGTSKWNKVEHRLFSFITMNWRGRPLVDYQAVVNLIADTKTKTGLIVKARLDKNIYERGIKVSAQELQAIKIKPHEFHGEWNYTIKPNRQTA